MLTESENPQEYRRVLKKRLKEEGNEIIKALRFHYSLKIVLYRNDLHRLLYGLQIFLKSFK